MKVYRIIYLFNINQINDSYQQAFENDFLVLKEPTSAGKEKKLKEDKQRNPYRNPIPFRFSGFEPTQKSSFGPATNELKDAYSLVKSVLFLALRKGSKELHGWVNFSTPTDCPRTSLQMQTKP